MDDYHQVIADKVTEHSDALERPIDYVEVGVLTGNSAAAVLSTGKVNFALLVDSFSDPTYASWQSSPELVERNLSKYKGRFDIVKGDSKSVLPRFHGKRQFDIGFVDGDHSKEGCSADISNMLPLLRNNGIMFVDDMGFNGIDDVVRDFAQSNGLHLSFHKVHNGLGELRKKA